MSYLRKLYELRLQGDEEAIIKYERIQGYEEMIAKCEQEIENCEKAIKMIENGQDPDDEKIMEEKQTEEPPF
jgi:hypothetical protein